MSHLFPEFTSSDKELNITYRYRCELYQKHIKKTPNGHVITEFLPDVPWGGIYNTINCAASHHFREGRWRCDPSVMYEYARFWCNEGDPRYYSFPIADSFFELAKVTGSTDELKELYSRLAEIHRAWDDHKTPEGMYRQNCGYDGMEHSISGNGIRPTINSYMYADKVALSKIAALAEDAEATKKYREEAELLRNRINSALWNSTTGMYGVISKEGEGQNVRELIGYIPWMYDLPEDGRDDCFKYLLDPTCFAGKYGLRTAEASHPDYRKSIRHECLWNGPVWPFATSQTLTAVIEYLNNTESPTVTPTDFMRMLLTYAYSQRDTDGSPYIDENMDPDTGAWLAREIMRKWNQPDKDPERGRHYNHSTFIDLIITGVCGIRPAMEDKLVIRPLGTSLDAFSLRNITYHGHKICIDWKCDDGLRVSVDGDREYFCPSGTNVILKIDL